MILSWLPEAWEQYTYWQKKDKKLFKKIKTLIKEVTRHPFEGTGKPEPLRENYSGLWSRRIKKEHRLVYRVLENEIRIIQCRYHYT